MHETEQPSTSRSRVKRVTCEWCHKSFVTTYAQAKHCSPGCSDDHHRAIAKERHAATQARKKDFGSRLEAGAQEAQHLTWAVVRAAFGCTFEHLESEAR